MGKLSGKLIVVGLDRKKLVPQTIQGFQLLFVLPLLLGTCGGNVVLDVGTVDAVRRDAITDTIRKEVAGARCIAVEPPIGGRLRFPGDITHIGPGRLV
ncbi:hypothetical protein IMZ48_48455 [Candidatus Bathyarchaeota archaeon]|nr:hypothetical protein [Candidatus Bathyarchaeota archaeon]